MHLKPIIKGSHIPFGGISVTIYLNSGSQHNVTISLSGKCQLGRVALKNHHLDELFKGVSY